MKTQAAKINQWGVPGWTSRTAAAWGRAGYSLPVQSRTQPCSSAPGASEHLGASLCGTVEDKNLVLSLYA